MRTTTTPQAVVLVAAVVVGLGGVAAAAPALAGTDMFRTARAVAAQPDPRGPDGPGLGATCAGSGSLTARHLRVCPRHHMIPIAGSSPERDKRLFTDDRRCRMLKE